MAALLRDAKTGMLALISLKIILSKGPIHGYALRKIIAENTGVDPPESSVYDALRRLEKLGLVESYWAKSKEGTIRKYYRARTGAEEVLRRVLNELCPLIVPVLCTAEAETA